MVIFQFADLDAARARAAALGVRTVWQLDLPDISGTHLHPADTGGAIVSLDRADPPGSWRWGGPDWTGKAGNGAPGAIRGMTIEVADPPSTATRWGEFLGADPRELEDSYVAFEAGDADRIVEIEVHVPGRQETIEIGGVRFKLT
jgi:hypothetical protein